MKIIKKEYSLFFGDQAASYVKHSLKGLSQKELSMRPPFSDFAGMSMVLLNQVHGIQGYHINTPLDAQIAPYAFEGDYMVTALSGVALMVETADCVPLVVVDPVKKVVALVHAGWRGALSGIVAQALHAMFMRGCDPQDIQAYCGPAARGCCYEVSKDFIDMFKGQPARPAYFDSAQHKPSKACPLKPWQKPGRMGASEAFSTREGRIFFDNVSYIAGQLEKMGIGKHKIFLDTAVCTICSEGYCSYRRQGPLQLRQMTIVALK